MGQLQYRLPTHLFSGEQQLLVLWELFYSQRNSQCSNDPEKYMYYYVSLLLLVCHTFHIYSPFTIYFTVLLNILNLVLCINFTNFLGICIHSFIKRTANITVILHSILCLFRSFSLLCMVTYTTIFAHIKLFPCLSNVSCGSTILDFTGALKLMIKGEM